MYVYGRSCSEVYRGSHLRFRSWQGFTLPPERECSAHTTTLREAKQGRSYRSYHCLHRFRAGRYVRYFVPPCRTFNQRCYLSNSSTDCLEHWPSLWPLQATTRPVEILPRLWSPLTQTLLKVSFAAQARPSTLDNSQEMAWEASPDRLPVEARLPELLVYVKRAAAGLLSTLRQHGNRGGDIRRIG